MTPAGRPLVEILYFAGCPNVEGARDLVAQAAADLSVAAQVRLVDVADMEAAVQQRFLGSPTIRVDGRDIEPGANARDDYALACRVYRTEHGFSGQPDATWLRRALAEATRQ